MVVDDSKQIALRYMRGWFVADLCSSLPVEAVGLILRRTGRPESGKTALKTLRGLKFLRCMRLFSLDTKEFTQRVNPGVLQLCRHLTYVLSAWHYIGCAFWFVSRIEGFCTPSEDGKPFDGGLAAGFAACLDVWAPYPSAARIFRTRVAATPRLGRGHSVETSHRRGWDVDVPLSHTPRQGRGRSVERSHAAARTWKFRGDESHAAAGTWTFRGDESHAAAGTWTFRGDESPGTWIFR